MKHEDTAQLIVSLVSAATQAADLLSLSTGIHLEYTHIEQALVETLELDTSADLLGQALTAEKISSLLQNYDFSRLFPELIEVVHLDESIIPGDTPRHLVEVTVRSKGEVWRIHQNDADPKPSNPHAHNLATGLKLHLGSGELFLGTRNTDRKVSLKSLNAIRSKIRNCDLPPLTR